MSVAGLGKPGVIFAATLLSFLAPLARASGPITDPNALIKQAVQAELTASREDHSRWRFRDEQHEINRVAIVVETDYGSVKRVIARGGRPLSPAETKDEDDRIRRLLHDPARLAKQKRDGEQDDKDAADLLKMLPDAFTWRIESQDAKSVTLHFEPNPNFHPTSLQSRVLAAMSGTVIVDKGQHRIKTISGKLTEDVTFGFGFLGRMKQGGTFRVERRELSPGIWQIVETHVHIDGKALMFKNIGQEQDEVQTNYTPVPHGTTLDQAVELSRDGH